MWGIGHWWFLFYCEESCKVISCKSWWRRRGGGQRREENVLKSARESEQLLICVVVCHFSSGDIAEKEERCDWYTLRSVEFLDLCHFLSAALSLVRCSRENIGQPGAEGVARAGLDERGQKLSKQDVRVEQECQWHCLCRVLKTERVKVVRMKPLRIGERESASVGYVERWPAKERVLC